MASHKYDDYIPPLDLHPAIVFLRNLSVTNHHLSSFMNVHNSSTLFSLHLLIENPHSSTAVGI